VIAFAVSEEWREMKILACRKTTAMHIGCFTVNRR
jgi:hypothetical protein